MTYTISQISEMTQLPTYVLRYYEQEGLMPKVERSKGGIRCYSELDLDWLTFIRNLKNTGMSIKQIKEFGNLCQQGESALAQCCQMLREHQQNVEAQIAEMEDHLSKLKYKVKLFTDLYEESINNKTKGA